MYIEYNMFRFQENMKKLRENPETNRAGLKWDDDEDIKMIAKLKKGDNIGYYSQKKIIF